MAKKSKFQLNDRVKAIKWPGHTFNIVVVLDDRYAIENDKIRAIATKNELTLIEENTVRVLDTGE